MKHLKQIVAVMLVTVLTVSLGFAGKAPGTVESGPTLTAAGNLQQIAGDKDLLRNRISSLNTFTAEDEMMANPVPNVPINKAAVRAQFAVGLAGTYSIPGDFPSIASAISVLNFVGISGAVTFELTSASYSEFAGSTIGSFPGAGTADVTFQPAAGTAVTVNFVSSASQGKGISFNGAQDIVIDGINSGGASLTLGWSGGVFPASDLFGATIYITGSSNGITIKNSTINGNIEGTFETQTNGRAAIFEFGTSPQLNQNILIDGNTIINATYGIKMLGASLYVHGNNVTISNNSFGGAFGGKVIQGILTETVFNIDVTNNVFDGIETNDWYWNLPNASTIERDILYTFAGPPSFFWNFGQFSAAHLYQTDNLSSVTENEVWDVHTPVGDANGFLVYGMTVRISNGGRSLVSNNRITNIQNAASAGQVLGFRTTNMDIFHNTVRLTGAAPSVTQVSTCHSNDGASVIRNNLYSNERTGGGATTTNGINSSPVFDYNAIYSTGRPTTSGATALLAVQAGVNVNGTFGPTPLDATLHVTGGPAAAENIGLGGLALASDVDSDVRSLTTPDAGADEFANTGSPLASDVGPYLISPPPGSVPAGVPQTPKVFVKNYSNVATGPFSVTLTGSPGGYSDVQVASIPSNGTDTLTFAAWTPGAAGPYTLTATSALGGDAVPGNDALVKAVTAVAPTVIATEKIYSFDASAEGWTGLVDWKRRSTIAKLGGVYGGSGFSWVTERPDNAATYTEGFNASAHGYASNYPGANHLISEFVDLSTMTGTDLYISFYHSMNAEARWDRSWLEYTTNGLTWTKIGVIDDPNGINWYATSVYANAAVDADNFDYSTANDLYGLGVAEGDPTWTCNGDVADAIPTGPNGYVYAQMHVTTTSHPALARAPVVAFRYVAFSDAVAAFEGWAFDHFRLGNTAPSITPANVSGTVYTDTDGSGALDGGETGVAGVQVDLQYFGVHLAYDTTDGSGNYSFAMNLPGTFQLDVATSLGLSEPVGGTQVVNYTADGIDVTGRNFGLYDGSISGVKYNDVNNNGNNDAEPGLAGWTIELHADSANGTLLATTVTDVNGDYSFAVGPGTYGLKEVAQATAIQTEPALNAGYSGIVVSGASGSGGANPSGYEFGNWIKGKFRINLTVDIDGDGVVDAGDVIALPSGALSDFVFSKDGIPQDTVTLGNTSATIQYSGLLPGTYDVTEMSFPGGWLRTKGGSVSVVVNNSGVDTVARYMDFKFLTVTGKKYNDLNGNGADDSEPGLSGWTINVTGSGLGSMSAVTDSNGNWSVDSVTTGVHNISEVLQAGWTKTQPTGPNYSFTAISGNLPNPGASGNNFGNFENVCISGIKYRDRNGDGDQDPEDEPLSGWTINLNPGGSSTVTGVNGEWSFCDLGPGTYTITETAQPGYTVTEPVGGSYVITPTSGTDATGNDFGNFKATDSTAYRTFTADQLDNDSEKKPIKKPKVGKPILSGPNTANMLDEILKLQGGVIKVGLSGQLNAGGKEKAYLHPAKQGDVWKTFNVKSVNHTGAARGLDTDNKGKLLLKRYKSIPYTKKNNKLIANLLALQVNLVASGLKTPAGLGALTYNDAGHALHGMSIDQIADYADTVMTNWEGQPYSVYVMLDSVAAKINAAFASGSVSDTTDTGGWFGVKLQWKAYTSVIDVPFLKASGNPAKIRRSDDIIVNVPNAYALEQNFPNPFNPTTTIQFDLPTDSKVTLKIYNMLGQEVATVLDNEDLSAGVEELEFDASSLSSGVYLYRLVAEAVDENGNVSSDTQTFTQVKKMVLVK